MNLLGASKSSLVEVGPLPRSHQGRWGSPMRPPNLCLILALFSVFLASSAIAQDQLLRIMAANISSDNFQSYPHPGPGTRIFQALEPDVVLIQEFNVKATANGANGSNAVEAWVDNVFGTDFHWFREPGGDSIPNGVISRWPILESGEWRDSEVGNRDFAFSRIDIPGEVDLWVVSLHLLTRNQGVRDSEARALVAAIRNHPIPEDDFLIIGGDFNTRNRGEFAIGTLSTVVDTLGPFPHDGADPPAEGTNRSRRKPYDWVLANPKLNALEVAVEIGDWSFPDGLVFDSRRFSQDDLDLSFPPVRKGDSGARQMQHMAVIRDFLLGEDPDLDFVTPTTDVHFGTADASSSPRLDSTIRFEVIHPFHLTAVAIGGSHPEEFALHAPDPATLPTLFTQNTTLTFAWTPAANDGEPREVTATLITNGEPGAVAIRLRGTAASVDDGSDAEDLPRLDLGGFRLVQTGGNAAITIPSGTKLAPTGLLVIGRASGRAEFEAFWGTMPSDVLYLNGGALAGDPGFPVINGGEAYRLLDAQGGTVDPRQGRLPAGGTVRGHAYHRSATDGATFETITAPRLEATPGRYSGNATGTGRAVITEISDATGPGGFVFEFIEIYFDAGPE